MPIPIEKILDAAKKAGFETELKVAAQLRAAGWQVNQNVYFIDKDENKGRELDVRAYRIFSAIGEKPEVNCMITLCIEVKKTEDPFIFYSSEARQYEGPRGYGLFHWKNFIGTDPLGFMDIETLRPFRDISNLARSYSCFKDGKTSQIQSGVLSAFKAAIHEKERCAETYSDVSGDICFFVPFLVVDGPLYECFFEEGADDLTARVVDEIVYLQNYHSESYGRVSNGVFVVNLSTFSSKIRDFSEWGDSMLSTLTSRRKRVRRPLES
jgi:hypothetical protein